MSVVELLATVESVPDDSRGATALHRVLAAVYELAAEHAPWGRATFGDIRAEPGSRNTVPERATAHQSKPAQGSARDMTPSPSSRATP